MKPLPVLLFAALGAASVCGQQMTPMFPPHLGYVDPVGIVPAIVGVADDSEHNVVTINGNALFPAGNVRIGNNGVICNGITVGDVGFTNNAIPAAGIPGGIPAGIDSALCLHWDDLYPITGMTGATIYVDDGVSIPGVLIITWKDTGHITQVAGQSATFQAQIFSGLPDNQPWIQFLYPDVVFGGTQAQYDNAASATIGYIQGSNAFAVGNTAYSFDTVNAVTDGTTLSIFPTILTGTGALTPPATSAGGLVQFTVACAALAPPTPPAGVSVAIDLTALGGLLQAMFDDGTNGDAVAGDNIFTLDFVVPPATNPALFIVPWGAVDGVGRVAFGSINTPVGPANDECGGATPVAIGTNPGAGTFSSFAATTSAGWQANCSGVAITSDVWFAFTAPGSGLYQIDTETPTGMPNGTLLDTVLELYDATCIPGPALVCDDDSGVTNTGLTSLVTFNLAAGNTYMIRVGGYASATVKTGTFYLNITRFFTLGYSSPLGPGSIQIDITGGPIGGSFVYLITFNQGNYPNGWFLGLDISLPDIFAQINAGFPFVGGFNPNGDMSLGPLGGLGFLPPIYSVAMAFPGPPTTAPSAITSPVTYTVP